MKKKPYYLHIYPVELLNRTVYLVVGDFILGLKDIKRRYPQKYAHAIDDVFDYIAEHNTDPSINLVRGRTVHNEDLLDTFIFFPAFPDIGVFVHELEHAKRYVLKDAGIDDVNGEVDAYLMQAMTQHFWTMLERDREGET